MTMIKLFTLVLIMFCCIFTHAIAQNSQFPYIDSGGSSIQIVRDTSGIEEFVRNKIFHIVAVDEPPEYAVVSEDWRERSSREMKYGIRSAFESKVILKFAYYYSHDAAPDRYSLSDVRWTDTLLADDIRYREHFIEARSSHGYDWPERTFIRYDDGERLLSITSDLYAIERPRQPLRYFGYLDAFRYQTSNLTLPAEDSDAVGIFTIVQTNGDYPVNRQKLIIKVKPEWKDDFQTTNPDFLETMSVLGLKTETLDLNEDESPNVERHEKWIYTASPNYHVDLHFKGDLQGVGDAVDTWVRIPLKKDVIDISKLHSRYFDFELR